MAHTAGHYIHLDHDQTLTATGGFSYLFRDGALRGLRLGASALFGSGPWADGDAPNGRALADYAPGQRDRLDRTGRMVRVDVIDAGDHKHDIRDGRRRGCAAVRTASGFLRRDIDGHPTVRSTLPLPSSQTAHPGRGPVDDPGRAGPAAAPRDAPRSMAKAIDACPPGQLEPGLPGRAQPAKPGSVATTIAREVVLCPIHRRLLPAPRHLERRRGCRQAIEVEAGHRRR